MFITLFVGYSGQIVKMSEMTSLDVGLMANYLRGKTMDEDTLDSIEVVLVHLHESLDRTWGPEDEALFFVRAIQMMGYEIKPKPPVLLN